MNLEFNGTLLYREVHTRKFYLYIIMLIYICSLSWTPTLQKLSSGNVLDFLGWVVHVQLWPDLSIHPFSANADILQHRTSTWVESMSMYVGELVN